MGCLGQIGISLEPELLQPPEAEKEADGHRHPDNPIEEPPAALAAPDAQRRDGQAEVGRRRRRPAELVPVEAVEAYSRPRRRRELAAAVPPAPRPQGPPLLLLDLREAVPSPAGTARALPVVLGNELEALAHTPPVVVHVPVDVPDAAPLPLRPGVPGDRPEGVQPQRPPWPSDGLLSPAPPLDQAGDHVGHRVLHLLLLEGPPGSFLPGCPDQVGQQPRPRRCLDQVGARVVGTVQGLLAATFAAVELVQLLPEAADEVGQQPEARHHLLLLLLLLLLVDGSFGTIAVVVVVVVGDGDIFNAAVLPSPPGPPVARLGGPTPFASGLFVAEVVEYAPGLGQGPDHEAGGPVEAVQGHLCGGKEKIVNLI